MSLTIEQRRDLAQLIEEEHRTLITASCADAEQPHAAQHLRALEAARRRLADGSYGRCVACGRDIEFDRLIAYPAAARCLGCQDSHERLGPGAGDAET
jgi:RNA polymerase-binding transcription factor DksA